ncbi:M1 family metallopeptidase [Parasegetibacter sp. NRK P23]|uniref:M1 family metallopeptidase n=1 Tax=Parasegetibacter sp. NRK P23 TaxID=2942999 RepID=UPI002043EEAC|nr:M1 family metallopeptidase [Parasegetibacter sp. NRK P23]MCM5530329.1 M1 family metallopeptidase [Parasegetibacter sp. NRK P23]
MRRLPIICALLATSFCAMAQGPEENQQNDTWKKMYRASATLEHDLVHTKLDASFDFPASQMKGKVWITLHPHFYTSDKVVLDAKGMDIHSVSIVKGSSKKKATYEYDGLELSIQLDKAYKGGEDYTLYIEYTAKPNEFKTKGSAAITDAKGLYFINPEGKEDKPTQIWTQGETEATSVWCPTIDRPNQKTTQEIAMTVPAKFITLSNGKLASQKKNSDGTRTDTWKMEQPHAPYLFFMGVGDYAVVKDVYKGKEVSYYLEPEYAPFAKKIFGDTPEMMAFFSRILGVEYPWVKYAQITARDYVSGAMENTTATLHGESAQQNGRELVDGNRWESTIAHELFHHWFGDLVTAESWSNLTVNESFANYSEYLWYEYKYGKDKADDHNLEDMTGYLLSQSEQKDLVRFYYRDKEDMFDAVSYNKGGRILHMLRNYIGDSAFFRSLSTYLNANKFKAAEAHQLRLAMEEVSGKDLNWFFNQWYFGAGHPKLDISYVYDDNAKKASVIVQQTQKDKLFFLPIAIDVYEKGKATRYQVNLSAKADTFSFSYQSKPEHINVDADKMLLCEKKDNKGDAGFRAQFMSAKNYMDRKEAIDHFLQNRSSELSKEVLAKALKDPFYGLRKYVLDEMKEKKMNPAAYEQDIFKLAVEDKSAPVRASALSILAGLKKSEYEGLFRKALKDSSYSVAGEALEGLQFLNLEAAKEEAKKQSGDAKGKLAAVVSDIFIKYGTAADFDFVAKAYAGMPANQQKFDLTPRFCDYLGTIAETAKVKKGVDAVVAFRDMLPESLDFVKNLMNGYLKTIVTKKEKLKTGADAAAIQEQIDYVNGKIAGKKGF